MNFYEEFFAQKNVMVGRSKYYKNSSHFDLKFYSIIFVRNMVKKLSFPISFYFTLHILIFVLLNTLKENSDMYIWKDFYLQNY